MRRTFLLIALLATAVGCAPQQKQLTDYVNPLLGTATLWDSVDLGFRPTKRTWGAEVFPGASLPNALVQASPVTKFHSGSGYQYEDTVIYGFTHSNKGHWNLCHIPLLPVTGTPTPEDYCSPYSHDRETAAPGYYEVFLDRYGVDVELTTTLRCALHRYTFPEGTEPSVLADLQRSNERVRGWEIRKVGDNTFAGWQRTGETMYFYAVANRPVTGVEPVREGDREIRIVRFGEGEGSLELRIGFSFVSEANARGNLEAELLGRSFAEVRQAAADTWNDLLGRIRVEGGTEREKGLFYSSLYRAFLWPALRSDVNGEYTDERGEVVRDANFRYYTSPSYWDDYRNKLILLGLLAPDVAADVISSDTDRGEKRGGFMPTFFHGDHASAFVAGSYLRGIRGFDVKRAYNLVLRNATVQGPSRPWLDEYIARGYIPEMGLRPSGDQHGLPGGRYEDTRIRLRRLRRGAAGRGAGRQGEPRPADGPHEELPQLLRPLDGTHARPPGGRVVDHPLRGALSPTTNTCTVRRTPGSSPSSPARHRGAHLALPEPRGLRRAARPPLLDPVGGVRGR